MILFYVEALSQVEHKYVFISGFISGESFLYVRRNSG